MEPGLIVSFRVDAPRAERRIELDYLCNHLLQTLNGSRCHFLEDVKSNLFYEIFLHQNHVRRKHVAVYKCIFGVRSKSGKLNKHDRARLSDHSRWLFRNVVGPNPVTDTVYFGGGDVTVRVYDKALDMKELWASNSEEDCALFRLWRCPDIRKKHWRRERGKCHRK